MATLSHRGCALAAVTLLACNAGPEPCPVADRPHCEPLQRGWIDPSGQLRRYVVDSIHFPSDATHATELGFDLDGDELCRIDNAVGQIMAAAFGVFHSDLDAIMAELVQSGTIIHLLQVRTTSVDNAPGVGVTFYVGSDADTDPGNNLGGNGQFVIDDAYSSVELAGEIHDGQLRADLGAVPLQIAFTDVVAPVVVVLRGATLDAQITTNGIQGHLGGSFTKAQFDDEVLPIIWSLLNSIVQQDCSGTVPNCCDPGTDGATVVGLFDNDPEDCSVSLDELKTSNLINSLLTPDVDLYDADGRYNPTCDGTRDSLSFGLGFTAVPAEF